MNQMTSSPNELAQASAKGQSKGQWFLSGQISDSEPLRRFQIHTLPFSIGRKTESSLCLPVGCISKDHAELFDAGAAIGLRDLGSTNGTYVNGEQLTGEKVLKDNDIIQFATIVFRVGSAMVATDHHTIQEDVCDQALAMIQFERLISDGGLHPHFQPIVKLDNQSRIGYEVLGRSRLFGLQSPYEMFQAASQLNLEAQLSEAFRDRGVEIGKQFPTDMICS